MPDLSRLLRPASIAVFGGKEARRVIEQSRRLGFAGAIWPVHPRHDSILGEPCFRSVADLPGAPDAAFIGVNRHLTVEIVGALAERGAGGAICYASGFREAHRLDDGEALQEALVRAAGSMPIVGPNCYGCINMLDGALLWPDQHGLDRVARGVAILTQSSNIAINLSMQRRGLPIAYVATAGNQAQTGLATLAAAMIRDPRVTALGLHIEGFGDIAALEALAAQARALRKPIVALKVGRSDAARTAAASHTAAIAGGARAASALLRRLGIAEVTRLPEMIEALKLLHVHGPLPEGTLASMSCSGGEASLVADAALGRALAFPPVPAERQARLGALLGDMAALANPLDYHTFIWADLERQTDAFALVMEGPQTLNLVLLDLPRPDRCDAADWMVTLEAVLAAARRSGARAGIVATLAENLPEPVAERLIGADIVPLCGIDEALAAAEAAAAIGQAWSRPAPAPLLTATTAAGPVVTLDESEAKAALAAYGLPVPASRTAASVDEAAAAALALGFPVAAKALGVAHKTEAGAVRLDLADAGAVREAAAALLPLGAGLLIERMAPPAVAEIIVGAVRDPAAGPMLSIGAGGIWVELLDDSVTLSLPAPREAIEAAIGGLRVKRRLDGYRGAPPGDVPALVAAVEAVAAYVERHAALVEEVDVNPILVLPAGRGVVAVDALIRLRRPQ